jgi:hypothetical protein
MKTVIQELTFKAAPKDVYGFEEAQQRHGSQSGDEPQDGRDF